MGNFWVVWRLLGFCAFSAAPSKLLVAGHISGHLPSEVQSFEFASPN